MTEERTELGGRCLDCGSSSLHYGGCPQDMPKVVPKVVYNAPITRRVHAKRARIKRTNVTRADALRQYADALENNRSAKNWDLPDILTDIREWADEVEGGLFPTN